ncbi:hypothetical protein [Phytohabitans houttuyneae]|uniref:Uncharacterized protein n=1 Tax=Phytohabitans houttuyneae TaxID=1076126 RepID=A0A6V8KU01_9ACTN|nr:hypothetical protein [Phytohabitans houttuyneae]GFJ85801.1 hypothetical protein Phou_099810 [Phytohabitans houttuyneae]
MEVPLAIIASATSLLIFGMRTWLVWRLGKEALDEGADVKIGGLNPLAPPVEIHSGSRPPLTQSERHRQVSQ